MRRRFWNPLVGIGLLLVGVAVAIAATRLSFLQGEAPRGSTRNDPAPEFRGIAGWLNSTPLSVAGLRGKVVLVDFWAYSCVNCVRTFPGLRQMYARYEPFGLEIVGIHAPEFEFEKQEVNVREAIERSDLPWPVALDNEMETWRAYKNHYWPHVYLIDADGRIRFDHIGEGGEDLIQDRIRGLLQEAGAMLPEPIDFQEGPFNPHITPEIYAGHLRGAPAGSLANPEGFRPDRVVDYAPIPKGSVDDAGTDGIFFVEGKWRATEEYLEAAEDGARVLLPLFAKDVFFVAASGTGGAVSVQLMLNGKPVPAAALGDDASKGVVHVSRSDLYSLLRLSESNMVVLTLEAAKGFRLYTFTFG
ncbi:MAG: redoxin domain-containing protein [Actinomycetota bacterium]